MNFEEAFLDRATFWGATLDPKTTETLSHTAWWLATGWTSAQVRKIIDHQQSHPFDIGTSDGFRKIRVGAESAVAQANITNDAFVRALALNDLAWTLAINGVDLSENLGKDVTKGNCETINGIPKSAEKSAMQALCLISRLDTHSNKSQDYESIKSIFQDTLGYVLLQTDQVEAALEHLKVAARGGSADALFRFAVAENANGNTEAALEDMEASIKKGYVPTHEWALLWKYVSLGDFKNHLERALEQAHPLAATTSVCPHDSEQ